MLARSRAAAERVTDRYQQLAARRSVFGLPLTFLSRYRDRNGILLASAVAFRLFLWLMPLSLLFAGVLAGVAGSHEGAARTMTNAAGISGAAGQEVVSALQDGHRSWWIAVVIGGAGALWGAKSLLRSLWLVHAHAWLISAPRPRLGQVVVTAFVFAGAWAGLVVTGAAAPRIDRAMPGGLILAMVVEVAAATGIWLAVSMRLPHRRTAWYDLLPGATLVGLSFTVLHAASRVYIPRKLKQSSELYGALGVAAVILAWLLLIGQVIVAAALVNAMWHDHRQRVSR